MNTNNKTTQEKLFDNYIEYLKSPSDWNPNKPMAGGKTRRGMEDVQPLYFKTKNVWDDFLSQSPDQIFVWSDLHINHANIIKYANRGFDNVDIMNDVLLDNAKKTLKDDDWVLFGGDVSLKSPQMVKSWLNKCPGKKLLILGNHDISTPDLSNWLKVGFSAIAPCVVYNHDSLPFHMWITHYPMRDCVPSNTINLHGHVHDRKLDLPLVNMCVEHTNYSPVRLIDLLKEQNAL